MHFRTTWMICLLVLGFTNGGLADIYRWDNGQVIPGTEGITPGPGIDLSFQNLSMAGFSGLDLSASNFHGSTLIHSHFGEATLTNANFSQANLSSARFDRAKLTNANFKDAVISGSLYYTEFVDATSRGFTKEQLYATASYKNRDLVGLWLGSNDLSGWSFAGQNLTGSVFRGSNLAGTDFTDAVVRRASFFQTALTHEQLYSTASFKSNDLREISLNGLDLSGWNLRGQDLSDADFYSAKLTNADLTDAFAYGADFRFAKLTGAIVTGAKLGSLSAFQLYSTASYKAKNLRGIGLGGDLTGWDFSGQDLTGAALSYARLANAIFEEALVCGVDFGGTTQLSFTREQLYSTASYQGMDLRGIGLNSNDLTGWDFSGQNLANARLHWANLTNADLAGADLSGADVTRANFSRTTSLGFTKEQLYSTDNYQARDLRGIGLAGNDLTGWDFSGQDLSHAVLSDSILNNVKLSGAIVTGADFGNTTQSGFTYQQLYSTANYQAKDLHGIGLSGNDLTGWDFSGQNLTGATFNGAILTDANLTGAVVTSTRFASAIGFRKEQLYATANYLAKNLRGFNFAPTEALSERFDLSGWDFHGQDLTSGNFSFAILTNANLSGANLTNATLDFAVLENADLTGADLRGAEGFNPAGALTRNAILPDGKVAGLVLADDETLLIGDNDGNVEWLRGPIQVVILERLTMADGSILQPLFEADPWDSLISFEPGIPVTLGGALELTFANDVDLSSQVGRTLRIFDWTGVSPQGRFAIQSPYVWDVTNLYTTGEVTLIAVPEPFTAWILLVGMTTIAAVCRVRSSKMPLLIVSRLGCVLIPLQTAVPTYAEVAFEWATVGNPGNGPDDRDRSGRCVLLRRFVAGGDRRQTLTAPGDPFGGNDAVAAAILDCLLDPRQRMLGQEL